MSLLDKYRYLLLNYPLGTKSITSFFISSFGDILCQRIGASIDDWDFKENYSARRSLNFGIISLSLSPVFHYWYKFLDKRFPGRSLRDMFKKVFIDRLIIPPPTLLAIFSGQTLLAGGTFKDIKLRLEHSYIEVLRTNYIVWPLAMAFNFKFIRIDFQVLFSNLVGLFWNIYLSFTIHRPKPDKLEDESYYT
jgi:Mpv17 / PMP22 family